MSKELLDKLRSRLSSASAGDRMYERPMSWEDADEILRMVEVYRARCEELSAELTGNKGQDEATK